MISSRLSRVVAPLLAAAVCAGAGAESAEAVNYGPISHKGLKKAGGASTSSKLALQIGLDANNSGIQSAAKKASNPKSDSYGKYPSLSTLQSKWGATSSVRNGVKNAFKSQGVTAKIDVTHLRAWATVSIGKAQKMFGTKWAVYHTSTGNQLVALPVNTPKLPKGLKGNVDVVAGMRLIVNHAVSSRHANPPQRPIASPAAAGPYNGGTPTRTGTVGPSCVGTTYPSALASSEGLFPNQILTAYGVAPLQAAGLRGQGVKLAIVGEAPTPTADVNQFRNCFGAQGTSLKIHNGSGIKPIIESSLDAMMVSMVAPQLDRFDLWVQPLSENSDDANVLGFLKMLAAPLQATTNGAPLPNVVSVSYGECESDVSPYSESRTLVERTLAAEAALGITVVVAAGDTGSSACARGVPAEQADLGRQEAAGVLARQLAVRVGGGGHEPDAERRQRHRLDRRLERHRLPGTVHGDQGWRRRTEHVRVTAVVAARAVLRELEQADGAGHSGLRRREPRLPDRLLERRQELPKLAAAGHHVRRRHQRRDATCGGHDRPVGPAGEAAGPAEARLRAAAALLPRQEQPRCVHRHHAGQQRPVRRVVLPRPARLRPCNWAGLAPRESDRRAARSRLVSAPP